MSKIKTEKFKINFVTDNRSRVLLLRRHVGKLGFKIVQKQLALVEPRAITAEGAAISKAMQAFRILREPVMVEDVSFHIDELNDFPGTYIDDLLETIGLEGILKIAENLKARRCKFINALAYIDNDGIPRTYVYKDGFGMLSRKVKNAHHLNSEVKSDLWKIFIPEKLTKPLALLSAKEKKKWEENQDNSTFKKFTEWAKKRQSISNSSNDELYDKGRLLSSPFIFPIPRERVAIRPRPHGQHKLLVYDRKTKKIYHQRFENIGKFLPKSTAIIINNSKVVKAALRKRVDDGTYLHVMYPSHKSLDRVYTLGAWKPSVREKIATMGGIYLVKEAPVEGRDIRVGKIIPDDKKIKTLPTYLEKYGSTPIPIYVNSVRRPDFRDRKDYQNCFAKVPGSIECPTAGLHFYPKLMESLEKQSFEFIDITLHIGYGTWKSFITKYVDEHDMDAEEIIVKPNTLRHLHKIKKQGRPILAVGTSSVRTLESIADEIITGKYPKNGIHKDTNLFIYPLYKFHVADMLLTNFAYPSTPIMCLAATFCGLSELKRIYNSALRKDYLFYTYGDVILIK